jgi:hypothetical protein
MRMASKFVYKEKSLLERIEGHITLYRSIDRHNFRAEFLEEIRDYIVELERTNKHEIHS